MSALSKLSAVARAQAFPWLPPAAIRAAQRRRLRDLIAFCERELPFYRDRLRAAGVSARDVRTLDDLRRVPTLTREEVVDAGDRIRARPARAGDRVFRTSGTSGLFMEIAYDARANDYLDAVYARALFATGYRPWEPLAYGWWEDESPAPALHERLGLMRKDRLPLDADPAAHLERLRALRPRWIYGFPSVLEPVARLLERGDGALRPDGIICHGELLTTEARARIERAFGCPVFNQYGAQEFNRIAWECDAHGPLHVDADSVLVEVLDGDRPCAPGEEGELVITGLRNRLMPLVRYRIGDLGRAVPGRCACGRGLPRIELTEGRADDVITLPDGRRLGPRVLAGRVEREAGIAQYRLVQRAPASFELRLVVDRPPPDLDARLAASLGALLGPEAALEIRRVARIPLSRRGKLRKIVSEVRAG